MAFTQNLDAIRKLLGVISWKKIGQISAVLALVVATWVSYENREHIYRQIFQARLRVSSYPVALSKKSTEEIDKAVKQADLIVGIQITSVDFEKNTRKIVYASIDNDDLRTIYSRYENTTIPDIPLFNNDENNNRRMVELINGEFICNPYKDTIQYKLAPEADKVITTVCANGIPPYYGRFSGIISIYLKRPPTPEETSQLRIMAREVATSIFERDIK